MKKLSLALLLLLAAPAFAASTPAAPTLQDNMKAIGKIFKAVKASATDASQNTANAANAGKMVVLFKAVLAQVPDAVSKLPAPSQAAAIADYQSIIGLEIADATELQADFAANNTSAAAGVITKMDSSKRDGHTKYNPDN